MSYLVDPVVKTELGPWQRRFIIKTLLAQGKNLEVDQCNFLNTVEVTAELPIMRPPFKLPPLLGGQQ